MIKIIITYNLNQNMNVLKTSHTSYERSSDIDVRESHLRDSHESKESRANVDSLNMRSELKFEHIDYDITV